jgi:hypothetical protein
MSVIMYLGPKPDRQTRARNVRAAITTLGRTSAFERRQLGPGATDMGAQPPVAIAKE